MANYRCTVQTPMSPEAAFDYVADLRNLEEWDPGVSSSEFHTGDAPGVGTSYAVTASGTELVYETLEYEPPARKVFEARTSLLRSYDIIAVEPAPNGGSTVTYDATLTLNGPLGLFDPVLGPVFNRIGDKAAGGLEKALNGVLVS